MKKGNGLLALGLCLILALCFYAALWTDAAQEADAYQSGILISEICAKNETILADNQGRYPDYIELHNTTGQALDLAGCILTDGSHRYTIPSRLHLPAGGYRVVFLSRSLTGFALAASGGDCIQLLDPQGHILTQVTTAPMGPDQVMLLTEAGYRVGHQASPGFSHRDTFLKGSAGQEEGLVISEILTQNTASLPDAQGVFYDCIELHNPTAEPIELGLWCLSDDPEQRFRFRLPDGVLEPGGYLVAQCGQGSGQGLWLNFGLSPGEILCLTGPGGTTATVIPEYPGQDISLALTQEGYAPMAPSLGWPNTEAGCQAFTQSRTWEDAPLQITEILLTDSDIPWDGRLSDAVEICNRSPSSVSTLGWYLSDGGDPYAYPLPQATLDPGQCLVIPCTPGTTGFALAQGETLRLTGPDHRHAPLAQCAAQWGLTLSLGQEGWQFDRPSLGWPNGAQGQQRFLQACLPQGLTISEVMTCNDSYLKGPYATTCDWVELHNPTEDPLDLSQYCLSDRADLLSAQPLPHKILEPGDRIVILLSRETANLIKGYPRLDMALNETGDRLYLTRKGIIEDYTLLPALASDTAWGRPKDQPDFCQLAKPTPGKANAAPAAISAMPTALTPQGIYDSQTLEVTLSGSGTIYYTTDCSAPNRYDKRYTGPITLKKTTVIRAICIEEGCKPSPVLDLTYLLAEDTHLPVVSLVTSPDNLWSNDTGIYTTGLYASEKYPYYGANYWNDWERPASVSLFDPQAEGFSLNCGIKIYGAYSRAQPKKSLSVFFRSCYGPSCLEYPLFGADGADTYESFLLRSGGQDSYRAMMRDVLITSMVAQQTTVAVQKYRPVVVFLNGEYWGVHHLREKISEHYVAANYAVEPEQVTLAQRNGNTSDDYKALRAFAATQDMTLEENYRTLQNWMDIENYTDYIIAQIYIGNTDNSNVRFFTTQGGKWRWILYDTDLGMLDARYDSVADHLDPKGTGAGNYISTGLINALLDRPDYRETFLKRMAWQLNNIWTEENIRAHVEALAAQLAPEMPRDREQWGSSMVRWQEQVEKILTFAQQRREPLIGFIQDYFDLTGQEMAAYGF